MCKVGSPVGVGGLVTCSVYLFATPTNYSIYLRRHKILILYLRDAWVYSKNAE